MVQGREAERETRLAFAGCEVALFSRTANRFTFAFNRNGTDASS